MEFIKEYTHMHNMKTDSKNVNFAGIWDLDCGKSLDTEKRSFRIDLIDQEK